MYRMRLLWTGFPGAPGFTNLFFASVPGDLQTDADGSAPFVRGLTSSWADWMPSDVHIKVDSQVDEIDVAKGTLIDSTTLTTPPAEVVGVQSGTYAAPSGASIRWKTATVYNGHRIQGRTFVVPLAGAAFTAGGALGPTQQTALATGAATFLTNCPNFVVWARPKLGDPTATPPVADVDGATGAVTSSSVPSLATVLRSRRD